MSQAKLAKIMGWSPQTLSGKLVRGSLRSEDFFLILDTLGIEPVFKLKATGEELSEHVPGAGRRVRRMANHVIYDTANSDALSNNFFADGEHEFTDGRATELYRDREGRYFFAEYTNWEGAKDRITPVTEKDAMAFIEKYGLLSKDDLRKR